MKSKKQYYGKNVTKQRQTYRYIEQTDGNQKGGERGEEIIGEEV